MCCTPTYELFARGEYECVVLVSESERFSAPGAPGGYGAPPGGQPGYGAPPGGQPGYGAPPGQPNYGGAANAPGGYAPPGQQAETKGLDICLAKSKQWSSAHEIHSAKVDGPFPHGDRFTVVFDYDITRRAENKRFNMKEVALYTVKNDKITGRQNATTSSA